MGEQSFDNERSDAELNTQPLADGGRNASLLDFLIILAKHKKTVLGVPLVALFAALAYALSLPNIYTGTTKIMPPQQNPSSAGAMLGQLGSLTGLPLMGSISLKNTNDLYVGMLKSRTVADNLIRRFDLRNVFRQELQTDARAMLGNLTRIVNGKDGIITIEVDDTEPKRAAAIANGYVDELHQLTQVLAVSDASQRRLFFERQLSDAREKLMKAENSARDALQKGGLIEVTGQSRSMLEITARLRAQITVKEVQLAAMRAFATESNPDLRIIQQELEAMRRELARLEGAGAGDTKSGPPRQSADPRADSSVQLLRNLKYYETMYELLAKQYELSRVEEAKDSPIVQVLDKALEPEKKSRPGRTYIVVLSTFAAICLAIVWVFIKEASERARHDPDRAYRLDVLRRYVRNR